MSSTAPSEPPADSGRVSFLTRLIATGAFSGYIPWASGTFGSLVGVLVYALPGASDSFVLALLILVVFAAGVWSAGKVAAVEGHRLSNSAAAAKAMFQPWGHAEPDPSIVVIDEIVGMWISLFFLPPGALVAAIAFILFRTLDILKPPPAAQLERIPGGWGIMLDDVVAGVYANLLTRAVLLIAGLFSLRIV